MVEQTALCVSVLMRTEPLVHVAARISWVYFCGGGVEDVDKICRVMKPPAKGGYSMKDFPYSRLESQALVKLTITTDSTAIGSLACTNALLSS